MDILSPLGIVHGTVTEIGPSNDLVMLQRIIDVLARAADKGYK